MTTPAMLLDLLKSLDLKVVPGQAAPGKMVNVQVVPDLAPPAEGAVNAILNALTLGEVLAEIDLGEILTYVGQTLAIDAFAVLKAMEFNAFGMGASKDAPHVDPSEDPVRDLQHYIPVGTPVAPQVSQYVAGLIEGAKATFNFDPSQIRGEDAAEKAKAHIRRPAALKAVPVVTLGFRVVDERGRPAVQGQDFIKSSSPWSPNFLFLPVVVDPASPQRLVRWNFYCDVEVRFTLIDGTAGNYQRTLGPIPFFLETIPVPVVAILTEHAQSDPRFPGRVLLGVPEGSPLGTAGSALASLDQLIGVLSTLSGALGFGIIPPPVNSALAALNAVRHQAVGRFRTGTHIGFLEWGGDWQRIFSGFYLFGTRRALLWSIQGQPGIAIGVFLVPGPMGVGCIPDLNPYPAQPTAGTAQPVLPTFITPGDGIFNDMAMFLSFI